MTTVLIVDDPPGRRLAFSMLQALLPACEVLEADEAPEAVHLARVAPIDVALIDLDMPGEHWLLLATELLEIKPDMRVAFLCADAEGQVAKLWADMGGLLLAKPLDRKTLAQALKRLGVDRVADEGS